MLNLKKIVGVVALSTLLMGCNSTGDETVNSVDKESSVPSNYEDNIDLGGGSNSVNDDYEDANVKDLSETNFESATVIRVVDGDTAVVNIDGNEFKLRMIGVDTPETVHPSKPVEYYGKEASDFTKNQLVEGTQIYLEKDVSDVDRYGRLLRYVWLDLPADLDNPSIEDMNTLMFNSMLVSNGYAQLSTFPPDVKYQEHFSVLEKNARDQKTGLWGNEGYSGANDTTTATTDTTTDRIKGNKNSKIYHIPGGEYYNSVSDKNAIYFESEEDAINQGYRKSKK